MSCGSAEPATAGDVETSGRLSWLGVIRKDGTSATCTVCKVNLLTDLHEEIYNYGLQKIYTEGIYNYILDMQHCNKNTFVVIEISSW